MSNESINKSGDSTAGILAGLVIAILLGVALGVGATGAVFFLALGVLALCLVLFPAYLVFRGAAAMRLLVTSRPSVEVKEALPEPPDAAVPSIRGLPVPVIARVAAMQGHCPAENSCFLGKEFTFTNSHITPVLCIKGQMGLASFVERIRGGTLPAGQHWTCAGPHHNAVFWLSPVESSAPRR